MTEMKTITEQTMVTIHVGVCSSVMFDSSPPPAMVLGDWSKARAEKTRDVVKEAASGEKERGEASLAMEVAFV